MKEDRLNGSRDPFADRPSQIGDKTSPDHHIGPIADAAIYCILSPMSHPLILALFADSDAAAAGAKAVHALGVSRDQLSIVARDHQEEGELADEMQGRPGAEIEDSAAASRLGELGGYILAAIAVVLPGIGPIVAGGPLAAGLGEAAGHTLGGLTGILRGTGVSAARSAEWERRVSAGAVLLGVHAVGVDADMIRTALDRAGAESIEVVSYKS